MRLATLCLCLLPIPFVGEGCERKEEPAPVTTPEPPREGRTISIDGKQITMSDRSPIEVRIEETQTHQGGTLDRKQEVQGTGTGLETNSETASQQFKTQAPSVGLGDSTATGGGLDYKGTLIGGKSINVFHMLGALLIVAAIGFVVLVRPVRLGTAAILFGSGLLLIAIGVTVEKYPAVWMFALLVFMVVLGVWLYNARASGHRQVALDTLVAGVSTADEHTKAKVKSRMSDALLTDPKKKSIVEKTISNSKIKRGL